MSHLEENDEPYEPIYYVKDGVLCTLTKSEWESCVEQALKAIKEIPPPLEEVISASPSPYPIPTIRRRRNSV